MIKATMLAVLSLVTFKVVGDPAITVNKLKVDRSEIFGIAEDVMAELGGRYDGLQGKDAWRQLVEDIVLDFKLTLIAHYEIESKNIGVPQSKESMDSLAKKVKQLMAGSYYRHIPGSKIKHELAKASAIILLARAAFGESVDVDRSVKQRLLTRYQDKYSIQEMGLEELLESYGRISTGSFVKGDDFKADKAELDKNAGKFTKVAYVVHRYTVRYYVIGLRWYVRKVKRMALDALVGGEKTKADIIKVVGYFLLPYSLLMIIAIMSYKRSRGRVSFRPLFACVNVLYLLSIVLYYFGMSPAIMYGVFVLLPIFCVAGYILQPFYNEFYKHEPRAPIWTETNTSEVSPKTGERAPEGKGYDTFGYVHDVD